MFLWSEHWTPCSHRNSQWNKVHFLTAGRAPRKESPGPLLSIDFFFPSVTFHSEIKSSRRPLDLGLMVLPFANSFIPGMSWSVFYPVMLRGISSFLHVFLHFNPHVFLKSRFPHCLHILSVPLPPAKVSLLARCLLAQPCKPGDVFMSLPLTLFWFFGIFF